MFTPTSVAQLDVRLTGDEVVAGSAPPVSATFILSLQLIQEGQLSVSGERMRTILEKPLNICLGI